MRSLLLPALLLLAAADAPPIQADHPWARASAGNARNGAAYVILTSRGQTDRLTGVSTPAADTAEVHQTIDDKGVMKMRPMADGIALEPGKPVMMAPGGSHVMLMGLKAPLKQGDTFPLTLRFEHAPPLTVTVTVEGVGAAHQH